MISKQLLLRATRNSDQIILTVAVPAIIWQLFIQKLHENERNWTTPLTSFHVNKTEQLS